MDKLAKMSRTSIIKSKKNSVEVVSADSIGTSDIETTADLQSCKDITDKKNHSSCHNQDFSPSLQQANKRKTENSETSNPTNLFSPCVLPAKRFRKPVNKFSPSQSRLLNPTKVRNDTPIEISSSDEGTSQNIVKGSIINTSNKLTSPLNNSLQLGQLPPKLCDNTEIEMAKEAISPNVSKIEEILKEPTSPSKAQQVDATSPAVKNKQVLSNTKVQRQRRSKKFYTIPTAEYLNQENQLDDDLDFNENTFSSNFSEVKLEPLKITFEATKKNDTLLQNNCESPLTSRKRKVNFIQDEEKTLECLAKNEGNKPKKRTRKKALVPIVDSQTKEIPTDTEPASEVVNITPRPSTKKLGLKLKKVSQNSSHTVLSEFFANDHVDNELKNNAESNPEDSEQTMNVEVKNHLKGKKKVGRPRKVSKGGTETTASTPQYIESNLTDKRRKQEKARKKGRPRKIGDGEESTKPKKWKNPNPPTRLRIKIKPVPQIVTPVNVSEETPGTNETQKLKEGVINAKPPKDISEENEPKLDECLNFNSEQIGVIKIENIGKSTKTPEENKQIQSKTVKIKNIKTKIAAKRVKDTKKQIKAKQKDMRRTSAKTSYVEKTPSNSSSLNTEILEQLISQSSSSHSWANISTTTASSDRPTPNKVLTVVLSREETERYLSSTSEKRRTSDASIGSVSSISKSESSSSSSSESSSSSTSGNDLLKHDLDLSLSSSTTDFSNYLSYLTSHGPRLIGLAERLFIEDEKLCKNSLNDSAEHTRIVMGEKSSTYGNENNKESSSSISNRLKADACVEKETVTSNNDFNSVKKSDKIDFIAKEREAVRRHIINSTLSNAIFKSPTPKSDSIKTSIYSHQDSTKSKTSNHTTTGNSYADTKTSESSKITLPLDINKANAVSNSTEKLHQETESDDDILLLLPSQEETFTDSDEETDSKKHRNRTKFYCEKHNADSTSVPTRILPDTHFTPPEPQLSSNVEKVSTVQTPESPELESPQKAVPPPWNSAKFMFGDPNHNSYHFSRRTYRTMTDERHISSLQSFVPKKHTRFVCSEYVTMRKVLFERPVFLTYAKIFLSLFIERNRARFIVEILIDIYNSPHGPNFELLEIGVEGLNRDLMRVNCDDLLALKVKDGQAFVHVLLGVSARSRLTHTSITHTLLTLVKNMDEKVEFNTAVPLLRKAVELLDTFHLESTYTLIVNNTSEQIYGERTLLEKFITQMEQCSKFSSKLEGYIANIRVKMELWKQNSKVFSDNEKRVGQSRWNSEDGAQTKSGDVTSMSTPAMGQDPMTGFKHGLRNANDYRYRISPDTTQFPDIRNTQATDQGFHPNCQTDLPGNQSNQHSSFSTFQKGDFNSQPKNFNPLNSFNPQNNIYRLQHLYSVKKLYGRNNIHYGNMNPNVPWGFYRGRGRGSWRGPMRGRFPQ